MKLLNTLLIAIFLICFSEGKIENRFLNQPNKKVNTTKIEGTVQRPIEVKWETLIDIEFKERYFKSIDMVANAPVFGSEQLALDGQVVKITGYVIPYDEEANYLSLSANPYASCFFCGNASPASVMSMYLKDDNKNYRIDDFKTFKGTLYLNENDPDEFIYYLKNVEEVR